MSEFAGKRGPKTKTVANSAPQTAAFDRSPMEPTLKLNAAARREFRRLAQAIRDRGMLGKVDPGHVSLLAKLTVELEKALEAGVTAESMKIIGPLSSQVRGLKRECSLTTQPSRTGTRGAPGFGVVGGDPLAEWRAKLNRS